MWEYGGQLWRQTRPPKSRHLFATIFFLFSFFFSPHATILESDSGNDQNWKIIIGTDTRKKELLLLLLSVRNTRDGFFLN